eukprot:1145617-Pelagomonas_calceolata.AAC.1
MITIGGGLQPGRLAGRLVANLSQPGCVPEKSWKEKKKKKTTWQRKLRGKKRKKKKRKKERGHIGSEEP